MMKTMMGEVLELGKQPRRNYIGKGITFDRKKQLIDPDHGSEDVTVHRSCSTP